MGIRTSLVLLGAWNSLESHNLHGSTSWRWSRLTLEPSFKLGKVSALLVVRVIPTVLDDATFPRSKSPQLDVVSIRCWEFAPRFYNKKAYKTS